MDNTVLVIFKVLAWIVFIGGFIAGIILGKDAYGDFNFGLALVYWSAFFVAGMLYYGFAEIIQLLTEIRDKLSTNDYYSKIDAVAGKDKLSTNNYYTNSYNCGTDSPKTTHHTWRCDSCGNMISENPCPHCNDTKQNVDQKEKLDY